MKFLEHGSLLSAVDHMVTWFDILIIHSDVTYVTYALIRLVQ